MMPRFERLRCCLTSVLVVGVSACAGEHHWSYEGAEGPANWASLNPEFKLCSAGTRQSPIDFATPAPGDVPDPVIRYRSSHVNLLNNGHTLQVDYDAGSDIEVDGRTYALAQFHFHAPSEHSLKGRLAPAEVHFVHRSAEGRLAVIGVLVEEGAENAPFGPVLDNPPAAAGPVQKRESTVDAATLLPAARTTYRYDGSLTTPPCTEGVKWLVMTHPIAMSAGQVSSLKGILHGNNRPVQPLNGRAVVEDSSAQIR